MIAIVKNTNANTNTDTKALDKALQKHSTKQGQGTVSIDKQETRNDKTRNNKKELQTSSADEEYYMTKNNKKLKGKRLETFNVFWELFDYKKGKSEAAQAWYDIPQLTDSLCEVIFDKAKKEAEVRPALINSGRTPKMAQGWITSRRWEDSHIGIEVRDKKLTTLTNIAKTHDKF